MPIAIVAGLVVFGAFVSGPAGDAARLAAAALMLMAIADRVVAGLGWPVRWRLAIAAAIATVLAGGQALGAAVMPWAPIAAIHAALAFLFGVSLLPRRTPVIVRMIRMMGKGPEAEGAFLGFVRRQCLLWTALASVVAALAVAAAVSEQARSLAERAVPVALACEVVLFFASHWLAQRRYQRPERWLDTARAMARPEALVQLRP
ncbi:MAG: hypothetical protein AAFX81_19400 [Pseudomonadota bacterium]